MALELPEYFFVRLTLDLSGGARQGELTLVLPRMGPAKTSDGLSDGEDVGPSIPQINEVVMDLPTELNMVLCKVKL